MSAPHRPGAVGETALVVLDRAPRHRAGALSVPDTITPVLLPPCAPELIPAESTWQFLRQTWLANRVFDAYREILDAFCDASNNLIDRPWRIMTIGRRPCASTGQA